MDVSVEQEREILNQSRRESERQLDLVHQEHQKIKGRIHISNIFTKKSSQNECLVREIGSCSCRLT